jgi:hypothetical protein
MPALYQLRSVRTKLLTCYADPYIVIVVRTQWIHIRGYFLKGCCAIRLAVQLTVVIGALTQWSGHVATEAHAADYSFAFCHVR